MILRIFNNSYIWKYINRMYLSCFVGDVIMMKNIQLWSKYIHTLGSKTVSSHGTSICGALWQNIKIFLTPFTKYMRLLYYWNYYAFVVWCFPKFASGLTIWVRNFISSVWYPKHNFFSKSNIVCITVMPCCILIRSDRISIH